MITLLHPSRGRAEKAKATFDRWMEKSSGLIDIEHVLSIDINDPQNDNYHYVFGKSGYSKVISSNNNNLVEATNEGAKAAKGDIIVLLSDDFDCPQKWDEHIEYIFSRNKCCVLKTFDGVQDWIVTLPIMDREYYEKYGYFYYPEYSHMFCDTDMTHKAELEGSLIVRNNLVFTHQHYTTGAAKKDAINVKADDTWEQGMYVYLQRVKNKFGLENVNVYNLRPAAKNHLTWLKQKIS
jgi:glycosyltransferase involved in cell wall biosynthesis